MIKIAHMVYASNYDLCEDYKLYNFSSFLVVINTVFLSPCVIIWNIDYKCIWETTRDTRCIISQLPDSYQYRSPIIVGGNMSSKSQVYRRTIKVSHNWTVLNKHNKLPQLYKAVAGNRSCLSIVIYSKQ